MRVSVALATHNGEQYLEEQLASIAGQTAAPHELVVADDASRDGTLAIVEGFAASAPFPVRVLPSAPHCGSTRTFERAIAACTGEAIALCDQDDRWHREKLEGLGAALSADPAAGLAFSDGRLIDATGSPTGATVWSTFGFDAALSSEHSERFVGVVVTPRIPGCTLAFRAEHRELALPFPDDLEESAHDLRHDAWIVCLVEAVSSSIALPEALVDYRVHEGQQVGTDNSRSGRGLRNATERALGVKRIDVVAELRARRLGAVAVRDRLTERAVGHRAAASLRELDAMIAHLDARIALPGRVRARLGPVLAEWRRDRYARYSNGPLSAIADVLRR